MATSVKTDEHTKSRLEELQVTIQLETGRKVTQQELLERLVDRAFDSKEEFVDSFREDDEREDDEREDDEREDDEWEGLTEEEIERWLSGTTASGDPVDEDEIDEVLYGSEIE